MRIEIKTNKNGAYFWELVAENNEILAVSESYSSKGNCNKTVKSVAKQLGFNYDKTTPLTWKKNNDTID